MSRASPRRLRQFGLRALRHNPSLDALLRLTAGVSGDIRFGSYTTAHVLVHALRPAARRDPRIARLSALLAFSMGGVPDPPVSREVTSWCLRTLRAEMARSDRILRRLGAPEH